MVNRILLGIFILFFPFLFAQDIPSLKKQYQEAYQLANDGDSFRYNNNRARQWAVNYVEKYARLPLDKSLSQNYEDIYSFIMENEYFRFGKEEAIEFTKNFILSHYKWGMSRNIGEELSELLDRDLGTEEQGKKLILAFLKSTDPFYSRSNLLRRYWEVYHFLTTRSEFSYDDKKAKTTAHNFIKNRYFFIGRKSLIRQYWDAYEFALAKEGLSLYSEKAKEWSKKFILKRGLLDDCINLKRQYQEAYNLAYYEFKMSMQEAQKWGLKFINNRGYFSYDRSLYEQFKDAFNFAYTGDFLPDTNNFLASKFLEERRNQVNLFNKEKQAFNESKEKGILKKQVVDIYKKSLHQEKQMENKENYKPKVFLFERATKWTMQFLLKHGKVSKNKSLLLQYRNAFLLAYSRLGFGMSRKDSYEWADKFINR